MATMPILAEFFRTLSKKSFNFDIDTSLISSRILGMLPSIISQNRYE